MEGLKFGMLTVLKRSGSTKAGKKVWTCKCECGGTTDVITGNLKSGNTVSCGCKKRNQIKTMSTTHGLSHKRIYRCWRNMLDRCYDEKHRSFKWYGSKGISVCEEWRDDVVSFVKWAESNGYSDDFVLDRIDSKKNYSASNCRWIKQSVNLDIRNGKDVQI